jgi:cell division protein FtsW (lipid II flippase)
LRWRYTTCYSLLTRRCKIGLFTRPERVVTLAVGLLASRVDFALVTVLAIIAVLSFVTAGQRLRYVLKQTRKQPPASG